jgi:hypothetical protein
MLYSIQFNSIQFNSIRVYLRADLAVHVNNILPVIKTLVVLILNLFYFFTS